MRNIEARQRIKALEDVVKDQQHRLDRAEDVILKNALLEQDIQEAQDKRSAALMDVLRKRQIQP